MNKPKTKLHDYRQEYLVKFESNFTLTSVIRATVEEVIKLAEKQTGKKIENMSVLDVGSGFGAYSFELEKHAKQVVGVEPDNHAYKVASEEAKRRKSKVKFYNMPIEAFSTKERFDLALSLTTIEHMPYAEESFRRVLSLLNKNGMIYLTAPNKLWIMEPHYSLPFLNWLPVSLANVYVRVMHKASSFKDSSYALSYFGMKKLFDKLPCEYSFYLPSPEASYLGCGQDKDSIYKSMRNFGIALIKRYPIFWAISKGFILVVKKN